MPIPHLAQPYGQRRPPKTPRLYSGSGSRGSSPCPAASLSKPNPASPPTRVQASEARNGHRWSQAVSADVEMGVRHRGATPNQVRYLLTNYPHPDHGDWIDEFARLLAEERATPNGHHADMEGDHVVLTLPDRYGASIYEHEAVLHGLCRSRECLVRAAVRPCGRVATSTPRRLADIPTVLLWSRDSH
jgi:hypothetical protein